MPIYHWVDKKTDKSIEVIRTFSEYEVPPTEQEVLEAKLEFSEPPEWVRIINYVAVKKGHRWGGGKGNWLWLLTLGGTSLLFIKDFIL